MNIQLWDIAGGEALSELSHIIYKDGDASLVVDDRSNSDLCAVERWWRDINENIFQPHVSLLSNKVRKNFA